MPRPLFDHFNLLAPVYEVFIHRPDLKRLEQLLELRPGLRMLDVGGGTGRITEAFAAQEVGLVIADPSGGMLVQAREKGCCNVVQAPAERLPFPDGSFDRVLVVDAFHHFWYHAEAAVEMLRVLVPGGRLVLEEPNLRRLAVKLVALAERLALMRSRFYRPAEVARIFEAAGGEVTLYEEGFNFWAVVRK